MFILAILKDYGYLGDQTLSVCSTLPESIIHIDVISMTVSYFKLIVMRFCKANFAYCENFLTCCTNDKIEKQYVLLI